MTIQNNDDFFVCTYKTLHFKIPSVVVFSFEEEDVLDM
jgi:hypothetical protein